MSRFVAHDRLKGLNSLSRRSHPNARAPASHDGIFVSTPSFAQESIPSSQLRRIPGKACISGASNKRLSPHSITERKKSMTHLDQNPDPPVEGSEYWDHMRVHRTDPVKRVKPSVLPDTLVNALVLRRMWAERKKHK